MAELNLMSWNTRLYEMGNELKDEYKKVKYKAVDTNIFSSVLSTLEEHLEKENAVAVLQELPYVCNIGWQTHELFSQLTKYFPDNYYDILYNISTPGQIMMTAAIAKKGLIVKDNSVLNTNRCVSFYIAPSGTRILGVHAENNTKTSEHLNSISLMSDNYDIILGDFNSGNYEKKFESKLFRANRAAYCSLADKFTDACGNNPTTIYKTAVDHILLKDGASYNNVEIKKGISLSDHYPITCKYIY